GNPGMGGPPMGMNMGNPGMGGPPMGMNMGNPGMSGPMGMNMGNPGMGGPPMGMDMGYPGMGGPAPYGQMPYGYPQMGPAPQVMGAQDFESPDMGAAQMPFMQQPYPGPGNLPVGAGGDCGCGGPVPGPAPMQPEFIPPTPPIYSAPYTGPTDMAQPPYMNPYGMGPMDGNQFGMQRYHDESNEYDF
ncbi:MAG: spore coat protein, partial [Neobacillus sp.]|nr:spore coat protein [Neobacillus sp.]